MKVTIDLNDLKKFIKTLDYSIATKDICLED